MCVLMQSLGICATVSVLQSIWPWSPFAKSNQTSMLQPPWRPKWQDSWYSLSLLYCKPLKKPIFACLNVPFQAHSGYSLVCMCRWPSSAAKRCSATQDGIQKTRYWAKKDAFFCLTERSVTKRTGTGISSCPGAGSTRLQILCVTNATCAACEHTRVSSPLNMLSKLINVLKDLTSSLYIPGAVPNNAAALFLLTCSAWSSWICTHGCHA